MFMFTGHSDSLTHTYRVPKNPGPPEETIRAGSQCLKDPQRLSTSQSSHHFSATRQPPEVVPVRSMTAFRHCLLSGAR